MHTIESTIIDRTGSGVVNASPDDCITVGTGGLVLGVGVGVEILSVPPSLRRVNDEFDDLRRRPRETRPSIRRTGLDSVELEESMGGNGLTGSCMPKVRTGCRTPGLAIY